MERTDPLADLLTAENLAGYYDGREPFSAENAESNKEAEVAERAVRNSLARIRAVVEGAKRLCNAPSGSPEESIAIEDAAIALDDLTPDDRRLLGMDQ